MSAPGPDLTRQAVNLFSSGRLSEAEILFQRAVDEDPQNHQALMMVGLCKRGLNQIDEALKCLARAAEIGDGNSMVHYHHGRLLAEAGRTDEAREALAQAVSLNPNFIEARTMIGAVSIQRGDLTRAVSELRTALRINPDHVPAMAALARALVEQGEADEAHKVASHAVKVGPESAAAQDAMARVFLLQGHADFAEKCIRNALAAQPENGELHASLASILRQRNRDRDALAHYREALTRNCGGVEAALEAAGCMIRLNDQTNAMNLLEQAAQRWPGHRGVTLRLAELRLKARDATRARELVASIDDGRIDVEMLKIRIARRLGEVKQMQSGLQALMNNPDARIAREGRLMAARMAVSDRDFDAGRNALEPLIESDPPDSGAALLWVELCRNTDRYEQACPPLERLLELDTLARNEREQICQLLANMYDQADQVEKAREYLDQCAWRPAPLLARVRPQVESGLLQRWLDHDWRAEEFGAPDDGLPSLVIVAGWPGSGRELIMAGLEAHPGITVLDPADETRRREALDLPLEPDEAGYIDESRISTGRKRFMRGVERPGSGIVVDPTWWEASAIPSLARHFPELRVLWPQSDPRDLALYWRFSGFIDIDQLTGIHAQEDQLWRSMSEHLPLNLISIERQRLLEAPEVALSEALGIDGDPAMGEAVRARIAAERILPEGRWAQYSGPEDNGRPAR